MNLPRSIIAAVTGAACLTVVAALAQPPEPLPADPADLAFEQGRWRDAIAEYEALLEANPDDRIAPLRIAQAERELGRHEAALETLEQARAADAPPAMVELERARNLLALGRQDEGLAALDAADHDGLRALAVLQDAADFDALRGQPRFERIVRSIRARVYPCERVPEAAAFDFWLGLWDVRAPDGTRVGRSEVTRRNGGCSVVEHWQGSGGSSGTGLSYFQPSRGQWRQVWTGSSGTLIDMTGGPTDDGGIHMEGTIEYVRSEQVLAFRATWTEAGDGRVRQRMEQFDIATGTWVAWFDGIYHPAAPAGGAD